MTPSNTPITPEIENIADNQGNKHTVIPSNHTHARSEVAGLETFMNTRSHKIDKTNNLAYAYVDVVADTDNNKAKIEIGISDDSELEYERKVAITWENIKNLERALLAPDSTPTTNSDNLVTSGGVAAALAGKQDTLTFDSTPTDNSTNPVTSGGVKAAIDDATHAVFGSMPYYITSAHEKMNVHTRILRNNTGASIRLTECIDVTALPAAERANIYWNVPDMDIPNDTEIGIRFVRTSNNILLWYDGSFDY